MALLYAEAENIVGPSGGMADVVDDCVLVRPVSAFKQAIADGRAFSFASVTYDPDGHDTILAIQNDDTERDFHVQTIFASSDTASQIQIFGATGVTMTGTAVVGTNLNRASGRVALATAKADETNNGEQAGGYTTFLFSHLLAANTIKQIDVNGHIIVPYGAVIGVDLTTAATGAAVTILGWFE